MGFVEERYMPDGAVFVGYCIAKSRFSCLGSLPRFINVIVLDVKH